MKTFTCPKCQGQFSLPLNFTGGQIQCPHCQRTFSIAPKKFSPEHLSPKVPTPQKREAQSTQQEENEIGRGGYHQWDILNQWPSLSIGLGFGLAIGFLSGYVVFHSPKGEGPAPTMPSPKPPLASGTPDPKPKPPEPPAVPPTTKKPVEPAVKLDAKDPKAFLSWLVGVSGGPRFVDRKGNDFAYNREVTKMEGKFRELVGHPIEWQMTISRIDSGSILLEREMAHDYRTKPESFGLLAGGAYEEEVPGTGRFLKRLSVGISDKDAPFVFKLKAGDGLQVKASVSAVHYRPSPTARSPDREKMGNWSYDFYIILRNPTINFEH